MPRPSSVPPTKSSSTPTLGGRSPDACEAVPLTRWLQLLPVSVPVKPPSMLSDRTPISTPPPSMPASARA